MGIGYSGAPRVTQSNMESRLRRLSRSLTSGNNGTPLKITLRGGANTALIEELNFEAAPGAANTSARRPVWNVFSSQYRSADNTALVNAGVVAGSWNTCGFLEVRCHTNNTLVWGVNNTFGGGPGAVVYMGSTGYMKADNTALFYDETNDELNIYTNSTSTDPRLKLEQDGAGDAGMTFLLTGGQQITMGLDGTDSSFAISDAATLGTENRIAIATGGQIDIDAGANTLVDFSPAVKVSGNKTASAWTTSGIQAELAAATFTDSSTAGSGTSATGVAFSLGTPTFAATNLTVTTTDAATLYIAAAPAAGTNMTLTRSHALWVDDGDARFDGNVAIGPTSASTSLHIYENNTDTTPAITVEQDGTGDTFMNFLLSAVVGWSIGLDNSDSDTFKISASNTLAASTVWWIKGGGDSGIGIDPTVRFHVADGTVTKSWSPIQGTAMTVESTDGSRAFFTLCGQNQSEIFFADGDSQVAGRVRYDHTTDQMQLYTGAGQRVFVNSTGLGIAAAPDTDFRVYANDTSTAAMAKIEQDGTGDASINLLLTATQGYTLGIDNSDSDRFRIHPGNTLAASTYGIHMTTAGRVGIGDQTSDGNWLYVVPDSETSTGTRASVKAELPKRAVDANESNFYFGFHSEWQPGTFDIGTGFTDSGSREGFRCEAFVNDSTFAGTLTNQRGLYVRAGHASGASTNTAVISNSIGVLIENLSSGAVTVTNEYGIYQKTASAINYLAGNLGVGAVPTSTANARIYRNDTSINPLLRLEQDGTGDSSLEFLLTSGQSFTIGVDNNASDAFKISGSSELGTTDRFIISPSGRIENLPADGNWVEIRGGSTSVNPLLRLRQDGTGDCTLNWKLDGTTGTGWAIGIDNDDADRFRISVGNTVTHTNNFIVMTTDKKFGIGTVPNVFFHQYSNDASTTAAVQIEQDGTGDAGLNFRLTSTLGVTMGIDNGSGDNFAISVGNTVGASNDFVMNTSSLSFSFGTTTDARYMIRVLPPVITATTGRTFSATAPRKAVSANSTNFFIAYYADTDVAGCYDISSGVTDSGSREAFRAESYASNADFLGTLAVQKGLFARTGISVGSGTITNSIGLDLEMLQSAGTITTGWGVYQRTAAANNYFAGEVWCGENAGSARLHVKDGDAGAIGITTGTVAVFENNGVCGIDIWSPDANFGHVTFGSATDDDVSQLVGRYNSGSQRFEVWVGGSERARFGPGAAAYMETLGSFAAEIDTVSVNTTLDTTHHTVVVDTSGGARVITLPAVSGTAGRIYVIKRNGASNVTVDGNGAETIDAAANTVLSADKDGVTVQSDGSTWWIISRT